MDGEEARQNRQGSFRWCKCKGNIYNNIMVDNYQGLEIFVDADTTNTKYGNNLFYASQDTYTDTTGGGNLSISIRANFYPSDGVG